MEQALDLAREALRQEEVPIGCVIVNPQERVVGRGFNRRIIDADPTGHAEIIALREAGRTIGDWRLDGCTLYVTLEPCAMCAGAMVNARVSRLVYGCDDPKAGAVRTLYQLCGDARLNHRLEVVGGVQAESSAEMLREFFRTQRAMGKK